MRNRFKVIPAEVGTKPDRIKKMKQRIITLLFTIAGLTLFSCGPGGGDHADNGGRNTGAYRAGLVFPDDIPHMDTEANALKGIDCDADGISIIRFAFFDASDSPIVEDQFPCSDHQATVAGIPAGNNRRVMVTAEDQGGEVLLRGEAGNITIRKNRITEGGDIAMTPVPSGDQDDGTSPTDPPESFTNDFGMTFNLIPAGTFTMGSPAAESGRDDNEIQHQVTLTQAFYMQTTEVTQGQWRAVMGENPSYFQNCGDNCPVETVSWDDVQEFLARINAQSTDGYEYRLPTEAQWEYAARAGSETAFCGGDITEPTGNDPILNTLGWYDENSDAGYEGCLEWSDGRCIGPQPVAGRNANEWGLFDMHGNVWEWCSDWYGDYPTGSVTDPVGPSSGALRVLRGGSWFNTARLCRSADRGRGTPGNRSINFGFRLAASLVSR
jgi:formylglycine-generating enzyme required for sulfatase activity